MVCCVSILDLSCRSAGQTLTSVDEHNLRKRIAELQEYRRMGVTTAVEAEAYETAKAARVRPTATFLLAYFAD